MGTHTASHESDRIARMDLETKIGQLFIYVMNDAPERVDHGDRSFLREYRPGGVIVYDRNVEDRAQISRYLSDLQGTNEELGHPGPMIVSVDHRGGDSSILTPRAGGLEFPAPIAQSAISDDPGTTGYEIGAAIGRDVLDVGFNLNLAPYGDFLERGDIDEFVFGNSMMGDDPEANAALSAGLVRGMRHAGLGTTYCVFPGGYGSLDRDPHHFTGVVDADEATVHDRYLAAPKAAIGAGVDAIMLSHFQFPALDPESRPATYSAPIVTDLLRGELGFDGLVMTDAIKMAGATDHAGDSEEAAIRAIEAGADVVLCSDWDERLAVEEAVRGGRIPEETIDDAVRRVLRLKSSLRGHDPDTRSEPDPNDRGAMANAIGRSLTWYRRSEDGDPLPAGRSERVLAVASWRAFLDAAGRVGGRHVRTVRLPDSSMLEENTVTDHKALIRARSERGDRIVLGTSSEEDLKLADRLFDDGYDVCVVHAGRVFEVTELEHVRNALLCYSHQPIACRKAIEVLYGIETAPGTVPVPMDD